MKGFLKRVFYWSFVALVLYFFVCVLIRNFGKIRAYEFSVNYFYFFISIVILNFVVFLWGYFWRDIVYELSDGGVRIKRFFHIQASSWLGKYLPGKFGVVLGKFYFGRRAGIGKRVILFSSLYENVFQVVCSFLISVPILMFYFLDELNGNPLFYYVVPFLFVLGVLVFIQPSVFFFFVNFGLRLMKKSEIEKRYFLSGFSIVVNVVLYGLAGILNGLAFFIFVNSIVYFPIEYLIPSVGIFVFAGIVGFIAVFAPAGFGVREGVLILFLQSFLPLEIATLIAVFSRVWVTVADGFLWLYVIGYKFFMKRRG